MSNEDIKNFIIKWNQDFPVDRWWRKKFNIAFNSVSHRESCFLDQLIDYQEDKMFEELLNKELYRPGVGDWLKSNIPENLEDSIEQLREEFKDED